MKNKKGADKFISVYWFAILFIVAGAVVYMVYAFYGSPLDVRYIEAEIMATNAADCLSQDGHLTKDVNQENFMDICNFNFNTEFEGQGEYYIEINFTDFNTKEILYSKIKQGNVNLKNSLLEMPNSNSFVYSLKSFYALDNGKEVVVDILSIVRKTEKNVR